MAAAVVLMSWSWFLIITCRASTDSLPSCSTISPKDYRKLVPYIQSM